MLQAIHDRVMGIIGWLILGLLIVTFAFFGLNSYLKSSAESYAAKVNGTEISRAEVQRGYERTLRRMRQLMGDKYDPALINEAQIRKTTLDSLINEYLVVQAADAAGLAASESALAAQISSVEQFKDKGVFSKERYTRLLGYQGMTPALFEHKLSREIIASQLKAGITLTAAATRQDLQRDYALQAQQRRFNYLVLPASTVQDQVKLTDQDIEKYYHDHSDQFRTRERVRVQYLELDAAKLKVDQKVDEEQLKALYAEHHDRYVTPERRHARHILIAFKSNSAADVAAAHARALAIEKRLDKGADFAELAKKLSDDPASAPQGGDLGTFGRGIMVPEVDAAVFSMKVGERSKPVKSQYGYHIIELLGIVPQVVKPLGQVRGELVNELLSSARGDLYSDKLDTLSNMAFEQPGSLDGPAQALGLKIRESGWFSRAGGAGIANNPKVVNAAFSDDVLNGGNNSAPVEIGDDRAVVVRVADHKAAALPPLQEIRDKVTAAARKDATNRLLRQQGDALLVGLRAGKNTLDAIATDQHLQVDHTNLVPRSSSQPSESLVRRVFTLPRPAPDKPVYDGLLQADGSYALIDLEEVQDGKFDALPESARKQAARSLNEQLGSSEFQMVLDTIRAQAKIQIPETTPE
jgi:peptidyl-prolyl cis-trans isomerase D